MQDQSINQFVYGTIRLQKQEINTKLHNLVPDLKLHLINDGKL